MYSPDGRWWWDGARWVPAPGMAPIRQRRWPWVVGVAVTALLVLGLAAAAANASAPRRPVAAPVVAAPAARDGSCAPQPCANDNYGWIVNVNDFRYDAAGGTWWEHAEPGNVYVTVSVTFTNRLSREVHADPFNFVLQDGAGVKHAVTWFTSCPLWAGVNLTAGATLGPKCLGFQATAGRPDGLTLVWTPQFGGGDYQMGLS